MIARHQHTTSTFRRGIRRRVGIGVGAAALALTSGWVSPLGESPVQAEDPLVVVFDDMEHGDPDNNEWFSFNGSVGGGGIAASSESPPPSSGGFSLDSGWGSGGAAGFYGGFGRSQLTDITGTAYFNLWINPVGGQEYTLEINLQEDDNGTGAGEPGSDDEFQYNCVVSPTGPCAVSGGGWQQVSIPLADFFDDNSFYTGGNGVFDATPVSAGGNGELLAVVIAVIGSGSNANFLTDDWTFTAELQTGGDSTVIIDDFENGLVSGAADPDGELLGFYTFNGAGSTISIDTESTPPAPELPAVGTPNDVLTMDIDSGAFAGYIHAFENDTVDTWVTQDWSTSEGISFWFKGTGSGAGMFLDILDNRGDGSTTDDAERWTVEFTDDSADWQLYEFPFSSFTRKEIGNQAPNDGLGLFEMHGYAFGALDTGGAQTFYFDQVALYGEATPPAPAVQLAVNNTAVDEGTSGDVAVKLNRPLGAEDPAQVSIDFRTEIGTAVPGEDYTSTSGTLSFVNGGPTELTFPVETFDNTKFTGDKRVVVRLFNPVDIERGSLFQGSVLIRDDEEFDIDLRDDFEQGTENQWTTDGPVEIGAQRVEFGGEDERPGQDAVENVLAATVTDAGLDAESEITDLISDLMDLEAAASGRDAQSLSRAIDRLEAAVAPGVFIDGKLGEEAGSRFFGRAAQAVDWLSRVADSSDATAAAGAQAAIDSITTLTRGVASDAVEIAEAEGSNPTEIEDARAAFDRGDSRVGTRPSSAVRQYGIAWNKAVEATPNALEPTVERGTIIRDFALGQDWTGTESLDFWFNGTGSGDEVTLTLKDNRVPDPGPSGWELVWSDEFDGPEGAPPNPANWTYEIGDVTPDGKNGWGNEELQYYTDDPKNSSTDGNGNLVITLDEADPNRECYYGPCEFESARLITQHKAEFAYGRIESRLRVPTGGDGLWPAFWSLGADITNNPWPAAGEIDVMEYVSRLPNEIFGTIHGPGYAGGESFSGIFDFGERVDLDYHTYAVEWEPEKIRWYLDGQLYHEATPADVSPNPWVFEKPFFLLLNFAIGGNFGGPPDPANLYPQYYLVDYVRVFQGPDTAERFETTFVDAVDGWSQVSIPLADLVRSDEQPAGAPDDGLGLDEVWGYDITLPAVESTFLFDQFRTTPIPPPSELVVTSAADAGEGSLRDALARVGPDGTISFDPTLAGSTVGLTSGELVVDTPVTIDGSAVPGLVISGENLSRVIRVGAGVDATITDVQIRNGVGSPRGGGVLNDGNLVLERVVIADNVVPAPGPPNFEFGGGGIYNGAGAQLDLIDSTVRDNIAVDQPAGGIFGFFGSTINVIRSTISGNTSGDIAGGMRSLGTANVDNSTFSGNTSTVWHGGGIFHTDGVLTVSNSTFADNVAPAGTASGIVVATFGAPASATILNNVLSGLDGAFACATEGGGAATITSLGGNVISDGSCNPDAADLWNTDAVLGPLADNGGPTLTHLPAATSPVVDVAVGSCPATDQRGATRPAGAACDAGAVEVASAP